MAKVANGKILTLALAQASIGKGSHWHRPSDATNVIFTMNDNGIPNAVELDSTVCEQGGLCDAHHIYGEAE